MVNISILWTSRTKISWIHLNKSIFPAATVMETMEFVNEIFKNNNTYYIKQWIHSKKPMKQINTIKRFY